ncbi:helix-turn-helix domain-containing protein [Mesorhizobium sp. M0167]
MGVSEIAKVMNCSRMQVYRILKGSLDGAARRLAPE